MPSNRQTKRSKNAITLAASKPRNPLVVLARNRVAGEHKQSPKAQRRAEKVALQKLAKGD